MSSTENNLASSQLKRTIGVPGALGIVLHQIVGGGVIALTGTAIAITGGGTPLAFLLAALLVMLVAAPISALGAAMPATGGAYTYASRLLHPGAGFMNMWLWTLGNLSLSIYGLAAGEYLHSMFESMHPTIVAIAMLTLFYLLNLFGASLSARLGIAMGVVMLAAFGLYVVVGIMNIQYWEVFAQPIPNGSLALLQAAALLSFAARGGQVVAELGGELKNPGRAIPVACLGGTLFAGILYVLLALPSTGVLPLPEVAGKPMSVVAEHIFNQSGFAFFLFGGSFLALVGSLNSNMLWGTKALLASIDEGWFPRRLGAVNRRFGTPHWLLTLMFVIGVAPILMNIDMANIANAASALQQVNAVMILIASIRLRRLFPQLHAAATFKLGPKTHWALLIAGVGISVWQFFLLTSSLTAVVVVSAVVWVAFGAVWAAVRYPRIAARTQDRLPSDVRA